MPTLKEYNVKLARLRNTHKMTKTMRMVAANKLRKAQDLHRKAQDYAHMIQKMASRVAIDKDLRGNLFLAHGQFNKILLLVITSERGLCGGFNNALHKKIMRWVSAKRGQGGLIEASFCGKKGHTYLKSRIHVRKYYDGVTIKPSFSNAAAIGAELLRAFKSREAEEIYIAYNHVASTLSSTPTVERLLPVEPPVATVLEVGGLESFVTEPSGQALVDEVIPRYINARIFFALVNNSVGENAARMAAMENATRNAETLIEANTLLRNRARQSKITTELVEIVAGAEALK